MWAVMMAGMMLPSAAPLILLYGAAARRREQRDGAPRESTRSSPATRDLGALQPGGHGTAAGAAARLLIVTPMMEVTTAGWRGVLLSIAGAYQFTPWKHACLRVCQSPLGFLMSHWRDGVRRRIPPRRRTTASTASAAAGR